MEFVRQYLVVTGIFVAIDAVWLTLIAGTFYKKELGGLLRKKALLGPAALFYALYVAGIVIFALDPALAAQSIASVVGHGALLGLLMYATYDLTNFSTLKAWPAKVVVVDMVWGTFVTGLTVALAFLIFN